MLVSCTFTVVKESPEATAVEMIQDCQQQVLVKFKGCRKLRGEKRKVKKLVNYKSELALTILSQIREQSLVDVSVTISHSTFLPCRQTFMQNSGLKHQQWAERAYQENEREFIISYSIQYLYPLIKFTNKCPIFVAATTSVSGTKSLRCHFGNFINKVKTLLSNKRRGLVGK